MDQYTRALITVLGWTAKHGFHGEGCRDCLKYVRLVRYYINLGADQRAAILELFQPIPPAPVPLEILFLFEYSIVREFITKTRLI